MSLLDYEYFPSRSAAKVFIPMKAAGRQASSRESLLCDSSISRLLLFFTALDLFDLFPPSQLFFSLHPMSRCITVHTRRYRRLPATLYSPWSAEINMNRLEYSLLLTRVAWPGCPMPYGVQRGV
jgi:hypothetical protein